MTWMAEVSNCGSVAGAPATESSGRRVLRAPSRAGRSRRLLLTLLLLPLLSGAAGPYLCRAERYPSPAGGEVLAERNRPLVVSIASTSETDGADLNRDLSLLLEEGAIYFRRAVAESDAEAARELYLQALLRFEWIVHEGGVENGRLLYNIGNIYYRLGELGKAILHYRRAEYYIPGDPNLRHNLRYIRSLRLDSVGVSYPSRVFAILSFRNTPLSPRRHLQLFALFFASAWIFGALFLLRRKRWKSVAIVCSALAAVFIFSSLIGVELGWRNRREGVVTVKEVVARRGDGEMYESSFQEPLHDGTEFNVLDEREGWYLIQLSNGGTGWIPVDSAELIRM